MDDMEIKDRANGEQARLVDLLIACGVANERIRIMDPVIQNTAWMKAKLDDARDAIKNSQIVISYDNGGGQKGIRENPLFKGYENLWKSYMAGMGKIIDCLPLEDARRESEQAGRAKTVLEIVKAKHKREA